MKSLSWLWLLLSWPACSLSLYTHWPETGWQDLFQLSQAQHQQLATQLRLSDAAAQDWLSELQHVLQTAPCQPEAASLELPLQPERTRLTNLQGLLHIEKGESQSWWYLPWFLLDQAPNPHQAVAAPLKHAAGLLFAEHAAGVYALRLDQDQLQPLWQSAGPDLRLLAASPHGLWLARQHILLRLNPETGQSLGEQSFAQPLVWAEHSSSGLLLASADQKIWLLDDSQTQLAQAELLASLSQLGAFRLQQLQLIEALVPLQPAAGMHWRRPQQLLLLSAEKDGGALLLMLRLNPQHAEAPLLLHQQQELLGQSAAFQQLLDADGWYAEFAEPLYGRFILAAGVWYQQLRLDNGPSCSGQTVTSALLALHLHYGTAVYSNRRLNMDHGARELKVRLSETGFSLQDASSGLVLLPELLEIKAHCAECASPLLRDHFPRQKLLAVYQTEQGGQ